MNTNHFKSITRFVPGASFREAGSTGIRKIVQVAVPGLCLVLTACGGNMEGPKIELNPHPKMRYAVTVALENAPGPFDSLTAQGQFEMENKECAPKQATSGLHVTPVGRLPISLTRSADGRYQGEFYMDGLKDENYFHLGVCHWTLVAISVRAVEKTTTFDAPLYKERLLQDGSDRRFFSNTTYQNTPKGMIDTGSKTKEGLPDPGASFSIYISARDRSHD